MTTSKRGIDLLHDPSLNKSTAFTEAEKQSLGIVGLVPEVTESMDLQLSRVRMQLGQRPPTSTATSTWSICSTTTRRCSIARSCPIRRSSCRSFTIPPSARPALKFGHIFGGPRGMYLSISRRGQVKEVLRNWPAEGRSVHLRHRRRAYSRPRRPRRQRHGHSDRQAAALHRVRRRAARST